MIYFILIYFHYNFGVHSHTYYNLFHNHNLGHNLGCVHVDYMCLHHLFIILKFNFGLKGLLKRLFRKSIHTFFMCQ